MLLPQDLCTYLSCPPGTLFTQIFSWLALISFRCLTKYQLIRKDSCTTRSKRETISSHTIFKILLIVLDFSTEYLTTPFSLKSSDYSQTWPAEHVPDCGNPLPAFPRAAPLALIAQASASRGFAGRVATQRPHQGWGNVLCLCPGSRSFCRRVTQVITGPVSLAVTGHTVVFSRFSRVRLFATPWSVARQAPLSLGFPGRE